MLIETQFLISFFNIQDIMSFITHIYKDLKITDLVI
jgi:hypothetical protein